MMVLRGLVVVAGCASAFSVARGSVPGRPVARFAAAAGFEPLLDAEGGDVSRLTPVDERLPGVFAVPHCGDLGAAYVVPARGLLVGVPDPGALAAIAAAADVTTWFLPGRVADSAAQEAVRAAFPDATRVVHRLDAGRGAYRRADDVLLSAGDDARGRAKTASAAGVDVDVKMHPKMERCREIYIGDGRRDPEQRGALGLKESARPTAIRARSGASKTKLRQRYTAADAGGAPVSRKRDDGPWRLRPGLSARWASGASMGACVLRLDDAGGVVFSGRAAGFDGVTAAVSAFGLEADHSAGAAATSLRDLAAAGADWDFAWLLPARGAPAKFDTPDAARDALRRAADAAARLEAAGKG